MKKSILTIFAILFATITFGQSLGSFPVTPNFGGGVAAVHRQRVIDASATYVANTVPHSIDYLQSYGLWNSRFAFFPDNYLAGSILNQVPTDGTADFDVARASVATVINEDGLMQEIANNIARIDFTDGIPHLLLEPQRTNLLEDALTLNDVGGYWNLTDATSTSGQFAPHADLTTGAFLLTATGANGYIELTAAETISNTTDYSNSIYIKRITGTGDISISDINNSWSVVSGGTSTVDGWIRYDVTSESSSTSGQIGVNLATSGDAVRIAFAQFELGSYPTSWIYDGTEGSTTTRLADEVTGAGVAGTFNSTAGYLYMESAALFNDGTNRWVTISNGTNTERVGIRYSTASQTITVQIVVGNSVQAEMSYTVTDVTDFHKILVSWKVNDFTLYVDGVERGTDVSGSIWSIGTLTELSFDDGIAGSDGYLKLKGLMHGNEISTTDRVNLTTP